MCITRIRREHSSIAPTFRKFDIDDLVKIPKDFTVSLHVSQLPYEVITLMIVITRERKTPKPKRFLVCFQV